MVVTRSGPTGLDAPSHVDWELSFALVPAPIPYQRTVDRIVEDRDKLHRCPGESFAIRFEETFRLFKWCNYV